MRKSMLLHPVAVAAVVVLVLNDHVLKAAFPGFVAGKLSDVAGLAFFPLLLAAVASAILRRDARRLVPLAATATALAFALVKLTGPGAAAFAGLLGFVQWLTAIALTGHASFHPAAVARDATDLVTLPSVLLAVVIARRATPSPAATATTRPQTRFAPVVMAALMAASTMATSQGDPAPTTSASQVVVLTKDAPTAARHVRWNAAVPEGSAGGKASLSGNVSKADSGEIADIPGVSWMLVADERSETTDMGYFDFECGGGCSGGATLVAWLGGPGAPKEISLAFSEILRVPTLKAEQASAVSLGLTVDAEGDSPSLTRASLVVPFSVSLDASGYHVTNITARVHVPASVLDGAAGWPLVGRVDVTTTATSASRSKKDLWFQDAIDWPSGAIDWSSPVDWLAACRPGADCTFDEKVQVSYFDATGAATGGTDRRGWVKGHATITVLLYSFDGRTLPANAMSITER